LPYINGRHNKLVPAIKWQYIEHAANAIIDRNRNGCGIVIEGMILYELLPNKGG
jgi:hypothetical protein